VANALQELIAIHAAAKAEFKQKAEQAFKVAVKDLFKQVPELTMIRWTQYTPYFNDGDECTFRMNPPVFTNADADDRENITSYGEYDADLEDASTPDLWFFGENIYSSDPKPKDPNVYKLLDEFDDMMHTAEFEELSKDMFDDHVTVTVTRDGIDVEEYSHD
jgi:hypothetical protein